MVDKFKLILSRWRKESGKIFVVVISRLTWIHFWRTFLQHFYGRRQKKKVRMRVVSVGWTYWHAKYSLLEQEWTSESWLLAWPLSYVFTEKIQGEKYSGITVISNITIKTPRLYSQAFEGMPDPWTYNTWNNDIWLTDRLCNNIAVARDRPNW